MPVPSGTEKLILIVLGLLFTIGTAFSGITEDATVYGDRLALAQLRLLRDGKLTTDVKELQSTLMMATVMEAKMEGYTSLEDIKTFAAIAQARLGYWLDQAEQIFQPKQADQESDLKYLEPNSIMADSIGTLYVAVQFVRTNDLDLLSRMDKDGSIHASPEQLLVHLVANKRWGQFLFSEITISPSPKVYCVQTGKLDDADGR